MGGQSRCQGSLASCHSPRRVDLRAMSALQALDRMVGLVKADIAGRVTDRDVVEQFQSLRVRCISDEANLASPAGQAALVTLVSLVARMGVQIELDVPDVPLLGPHPPLRGSSIRAALIDLGHDLVPGSGISAERDAPCDVSFILGDTAAPRHIDGWRLIGNHWAGAIVPPSLRGRRWRGSWSIGAMTAAGLAAPEVFKIAVRSMPLRHATVAEMLAPCTTAAWAFGTGALRLPSDAVTVDIVSAGAITQAALFVMLRLPIKLSGRLFDADTVEISNINRQLLYRRSDYGLKVAIVERAGGTHYACTPIPKHFGAVNDPGLAPLAPYVLVGVDDIPARWDVQRATNGWLGIAGTSHLSASISSHSPGVPCAGCLHPRDDAGRDGPIPTVSFVSFWAGLALAVRFIREVGRRPYGSDRQHLWLSPLRLDQPNAALWHPVAPRRDCPVLCSASRDLVA